MSAIQLKTASGKLEHILCLGAHCDDIEIGCGAALLEILERQPGISVSWVVFTSTDDRRREAEQGAKLFTTNAANLNLHIFDYRDGFLPYTNGAIKETFESLKSLVPNPDLVFTHYRHDLHQDHRLVSELTGNTFRNHQVLEYEIPKWDGDMGQPNAFIEISEKNARDKIRFLQQVYNSQQNKRWFTDDLFWSLMRIRGMEGNATSNVAEGFYSRKTRLQFGG